MKQKKRGEIQITNADTESNQRLIFTVTDGNEVRMWTQDI